MKELPGRKRRVPRLDRPRRRRTARRDDGRPPGLVPVGIVLGAIVLLGIFACVIGRPIGSALMFVGVFFVMVGVLYGLYLYR